ncbi:MAG: alanine/glycine:cation symporter family protein [bacterium]|jgi:AGCS family alanine or glycine:cation symporter
MIEIIQQTVTAIGNFFWGPPLFIAVLGTGLYYTIAFRFTTFSKVGDHFRNTYGAMFSKVTKGEGTFRSFAAACLASTMGVGSVAGVATAITMGGPGAIFWMWVTALLGASTKSAEIILGQRYRVKFESMDEYLCGRNYVLKNGLGWHSLARILAWTFITSPWSLLVQTNALVTTVEEGFGLDTRIGLWLVFLSLTVVVAGGVRRIAMVVEKIVPLMAGFYISAGLILLVINYSKVMPILWLIVRSAFTPAAGTGGFAGATVMQAARFGVARGVYSCEAGMGSGMGAHAGAIVDHPVRQASWGLGESFINTIIVCSITALSILITGSHISHPGVTGAPLAAIAFTHVYGPAGGQLVAVAVTLFAWVTMLSAYYGGQKSVNFLFGDTKANKFAMRFWFFYYLIPIFLAGADTGLLWIITDTMMIIGVASGIAALVALRKVVLDLHNDYWYRYLPALNAGENPPPVSFVSKP